MEDKKLFTYPQLLATACGVFPCKPDRAAIIELEIDEVKEFTMLDRSLLVFKLVLVFEEVGCC